MSSIMKTHPLFKIMNSSMVNLPSPSNITSWWNFGSLLGLCLMSQLMTGLFLAMHYTSDISSAFESISHISRDVNYGWFLRMTHANGASFFFISLYLHIGRGIYFSSYLFTMTWSVGLMILLATMAAAFLGYVLPWGQMSFWGATVITNLFSAIPILGEDIVGWLWGGFAVDKATLTRFFALHFLIPFILISLAMIHLLFLHQTGSNNPLGLFSDVDKIIFHPYFTIKDSVGMALGLMVLFMLNMINPWVLGDSENFIPANPLLTPVHIQPEWYYLFAYAILRAIPNKLGGVIALMSAVVILLILPEVHKFKFRGLVFYPLSTIFFWALISVFLLLTWIGARPVESPFILVSQGLTILYFSFYITVSPISKVWDSLLK